MYHPTISWALLPRLFVLGNVSLEVGNGLPPPGLVLLSVLSGVFSHWFTSGCRGRWRLCETPLPLMNSFSQTEPKLPVDSSPGLGLAVWLHERPSPQHCWRHFCEGGPARRTWLCGVLPGLPQNPRGWDWVAGESRRPRSAPAKTAPVRPGKTQGQVGQCHWCGQCHYRPTGTALSQR